MTTERKIDFRFLEKDGFEISECIKFQGWEYLCSLNLSIYLNLVREFYGSAKIKANLFKYEVKGVRINLSIEKLKRLLRAPTVGVERLDDRAKGLHLLFGRDDALDFEEILAKHRPLSIVYSSYGLQNFHPPD